MNEHSKNYVAERKEDMRMWFELMNGLYLNFSSIIISLSVAAIGFAAFHLLENGYDSEKYKTFLDHIPLFCLLGGGLILLVSCFFGLTHLRKNLEFVKCTADDFAIRYMEAVTNHHQKNTDSHTDEEKNTSKCESPKSDWWHWQMDLFYAGMILLVLWVGFDFFTSSSEGSP